MSQAPLKPWESGNNETSIINNNENLDNEINNVNDHNNQTQNQPVVPPRPPNLMNPMYNDTFNSMGAMGNMGGMGGMGGMYGGPFGGGGMYNDGFGGGYGSFGNRFSRFGGYGYGNPYGYNGYRGGYGPYGDPSSLSQRMESSTQATFQLLESIVGAFGGFAQMLESTFMATHSSFYAMIGVAEQFGHFKTYFGQILSAFNVIRWLKILVARARGRSIKQDNNKNVNKPSKKPLIIFLITVIGLPWLMAKLIKIASQAPVNQHLLIGSNGERIDPNQLKFVRVTHDYTPPNDRKNMELDVKVGDIVAVLKYDQDWLNGRTRDGRIGWIPKNFVNFIE